MTVSATTSMKLLAISILSWLLGLGVYLAFLYFYYEQVIGRADLIAVAVWSLMAASVTFPTVHLPIMLLMRKLLGGSQPAIIFAVASAMVFIVPTTLIFWMFSTSFSNFILSLVSPEALLLYCMFAAAGLSFGFGFARCFHREPVIS